MDASRIMRRRAAAGARANQMISRIGVSWPNIPLILDRWAAFVGDEVAVPDAEESLLEQSLRAGRETVAAYAPPARDDRVEAVAFLAGTICCAEAVRYLTVMAEHSGEWEAGLGAFPEWRTNHPGPLSISWRRRPSGDPVEGWLVTDTDRRVLGETYREVMERLLPVRRQWADAGDRTLEYVSHGG